MAPMFQVFSQKAMIVAGYQPAALLIQCRVCRDDNVLNNQLSSFTAQISKIDKFWVQQSSHLILFMNKAYWHWPLGNVEFNINEVKGIIKGDPIITSGLSPTLREWHDES